MAFAIVAVVGCNSDGGNNCGLRSSSSSSSSSSSNDGGLRLEQ